MNDEMTPFPELISDETAFALSEAAQAHELMEQGGHFGNQANRDAMNCRSCCPPGATHPAALMKI